MDVYDRYQDLKVVAVSELYELREWLRGSDLLPTLLRISPALNSHLYLATCHNEFEKDIEGRTCGFLYEIELDWHDYKHLR